MKVIFKWICVVLFASTFSFKVTKAANCGSSDPIIIPVHNWSSQIAMSHAVGQMLTNELGCNVKYVTTDPQAVYEAIRVGEATFELQVWQESFGEAFNSALDKGGILDAGKHDAITRSDWWLPNFVIEMCPGLPDWKALNNCAEMFARSDSNGKGVYIDGPLEWLNDQERAKNLNMNFEIKNVDGVEALWAELESAYKTRTAVVLFNWSPNFTDALYGGLFVEFPPWSNECLKDPEWGPNPDATGDCGSPVGGHLKKAAWHGMPTKWPAAYKALTRMNFTTKMIGTLAMYVDVDKLDYPDAAARWIKENPDAVYAWFHSAM